MRLRAALLAAALAAGGAAASDPAAGDAVFMRPNVYFGTTTGGKHPVLVS